MNKMIVSNLMHRPLRSLISVLAVAIEVVLILLIEGFALGTLDDSRNRQAGVGADIMVKPPGSSNFAALSSAPVSVKLADILRKQPHVAAVAPVVVQTTNKLELLNGIDLKDWEALGGPMRYLAGGPFQGPDDMIVDEYYAGTNKVHIGDTVTALNHRFRISGIIPQGRGSRSYVPITTLQDLTGNEGKATIFYVRTDEPKEAEAVAKQLNSIPHMETYNIVTVKEWISLMSANNIPMLSKFIDI